MANIGLIDCDQTNFPNLALMKIAAYHRKKGNKVEMLNSFQQYDKVYISKVFDDVYSKFSEPFILSDEIVRGGTGYGLNNKLPGEIEHIKPAYDLYNIKNTAYGFLTRGCPRACPFCIVAEKEGRKSEKVADLNEFWTDEKNIVLLDPNILACKDCENLLLQLAESKAVVDFTQGLDARLLTKEIIELLNKINIKVVHFAWDLPQFSDSILKGLELYSKFGKIHNVRNRKVYMITNFGTTHEYDLFRVKKLQELNYDPYVMIYNKPTAPKITRQLQRYCNNKFVFMAAKSFDDYLNYAR